jgi:GT2 family glycosyltransferase
MGEEAWVADRISVVIAARNARRTLPEQLAALASQDYSGDVEVVVVDNGSTDGTGAVARSWAARLPGLRVVDAFAGRGFPYARNVGARAAAGSFLLFCDADDVVSEGWLSAMADAARSCVAVTGALNVESLNAPRVLAWNGGPRARAASASPSSLRAPLPFAPGCNCGVARWLFDELGGFDEAFAGGSDDKEFFWRLQLRGHSICSVPAAVVHYRHRVTLRSLAKQQYRYGISDARLYRKFRDQGMTWRPFWVAVKAWAKSILTLPLSLRNHTALGRWIRMTSRNAGRLVGSLRNRIVCL